MSLTIPKQRSNKAYNGAPPLRSIRSPLGPLSDLRFPLRSLEPENFQKPLVVSLEATGMVELGACVRRRVLYQLCRRLERAMLVGRRACVSAYAYCCYALPTVIEMGAGALLTSGQK